MSRRLAAGDDLVGNWLSLTSGTHITCIKKQYLQNTYRCSWDASFVDIQWEDGKFIWNSGRINAEIDTDSIPNTLSWGANSVWEKIESGIQSILCVSIYGQNAIKHTNVLDQRIVSIFFRNRK